MPTSPRPPAPLRYRDGAGAPEAYHAHAAAPEAPPMEVSAALSGHVLVLNQDYRALSVCSVERALVLVFLQKADLIAADDDRVVRSPRARHPWPSIVRLRRYKRVPYKRVMISRKNVMRRDRFTCQYCGGRDKLTIDHVHPKSRGGRDTWTNLVAACMDCNNRKGNRTPKEAGMPLVRQPFTPSHVMFIRDFVGHHALEDTWKPYLFLA